MIISGFVADILRTKHVLQTTNVRKLFNAVGKFNDEMTRHSLFSIGPSATLFSHSAIKQLITCSKLL